MIDRQKLIDIYIDTKNICKDLEAPYSHKYKNGAIIIEPTLKKKGNISIESLDTVSCLIKYSDKKTAVLNNASSKRRGGGVEKGSVAQEECLFRCSNLFQIPIELYPIRQNEYIYSRGVSFVKDFHYNVLDTPIMADVITMPAINLNLTHIDNPEPFDMENYSTVVTEKIESIFISAIYNGCDNIILGAWGCGVFKNNPSVIAQHFKNISVKYKEHFDNIVYAIINDNNSVANNYEIFKNVFENKNENI